MGDTCRTCGLCRDYTSSSGVRRSIWRISHKCGAVIGYLNRKINIGTMGL